MRFGIIAHLISHSGTECEYTTILKFGLHFTFQTQNDMPFAAPVIGQVTCRVLDLANTDGTEHQGLPDGLAGVPLMNRFLDGIPLGGVKGMGGYFHVISPLGYS